MTRPLIYLGAALVVTALAAGVYFALMSLPGRAVVGGGDPVEGQALYQQNCAMCHGVNLEGQPNWQSPGDDGKLPAPPHDKTGHTWHHTDKLLFTYTKLGGKEALAQQGVDFTSGMPAFGDQLSDQQIRDILAYIKSTWPDRERKTQAERTEAERLLEEENQ